jgi:hypothetical protein
MDEASTSASAGATRRAFPPARSGGESHSDGWARFDLVASRLGFHAHERCGLREIVASDAGLVALRDRELA